MFNEFDVAATLLLSTGLIVLGAALIRTPAFAKVFGGLSVAFGAAQIIGISLFSTNSTAYAPFALLAFLIFPIVFGSKLYRLSKVP
jgi:streptogramin lyase